MPLIEIREGKFEQGETNSAILKNAKDAIDQLTYADLFRNQGRLAIVGSKTTPPGVRVDMQAIVRGSYSGGENQDFSNIQVQINGQRKPGESTTIAAVLVGRRSAEIHTVKKHRPEGADHANQTGVLRKVKEVLKKSLYDEHIYRINGQAP